MSRPSRQIGRLSVLAIVIAVGACGIGMGHEDRVRRAEESLRQGDYRSASIDLRAVLQADPDHAQARLLLGVASLETGDGAGAEKELRRAKELGIPAERVVVPLASALTATGRFAEAVAMLETDYPATGARTADFFATLGGAHLGLGQYAEAQADLERALELAPDDPRLHLALAQVYVRAGRLSEAERVLDALTSRDADHIPAWLARGEVALQTRNFARAKESFTTSLELAAEHSPAQRAYSLLGLTEVALQRNELDSARDLADQAAALAPDEPAVQLINARVALARRDFLDAKSRLQRLLALYPNFSRAQLLLGATSMQLGEAGQAEMYISSVVAAEPDNEEAKLLMAQLRLSQARPEDVRTVLDPVLEAGSASPQALALIDRASSLAANRDAATDAYASYLDENPEDLARRLDLAALYVMVDRTEDAQRLLEALPAADAREIGLGLSALAQDDFDDFERRIEARAAVADDPSVFLNFLGRIALVRGRAQTARTVYGRSLEISPRNVEALMGIARLDSERGDLAAARRGLETVLAVDAANLSAMLGLARLAEQERDIDEALEWVEKAAAAQPDAVEPKLLLARYHLARNDAVAAQQWLSQALAVAPKNAMALNLAGVADLRAGRTAEAVARFKEAVEAAPGDLNVRLNLALAHMRAGDRTAAVAVLQASAEQEPNHLPSHALLATIDITEGRFAAAVDRAMAMRSMDPASPIPYQIEGDARFAEREYAAAAAAYDEAMRRNAGQSAFVRAYQARRLQGHPEPYAPLRGWLGDHPNDLVVRHVLADGYISAGDARGAAEAYERIVALAPTDAAALNNLAWAYQQLGDARALATAREA
jgi:putative PEP-CTERM system TPR-repeat lipoprotein